MTKLTEFLKSVEDRAKAATSGPWQPFTWGDGSSTAGCSNVGSDVAQVTIAKDIPDDDCLFIAASRTDIPTLIAICKALHGALDYTANAYRVEGCGWADERIPRPRGLDPKGSPQIKARKALSEVEKIIGEGK